MEIIKTLTVDWHIFNNSTNSNSMLNRSKKQTVFYVSFYFLVQMQFNAIECIWFDFVVQFFSFSTLKCSFLIIYDKFLLKLHVSDHFQYFLIFIFIFKKKKIIISLFKKNENLIFNFSIFNLKCFKVFFVLLVLLLLLLPRPRPLLLLIVILLKTYFKLTRVLVVVVARRNFVIFLDFVCCL